MNNAEILKQVELDWKTVRPDLDPWPMLAVLALLRTTIEVEKVTESLYTTYGLNTATFGVLATLRRSAPIEGMTLTQLAQFVLVTPASITNRVDRLEKRGLVERHAVEGDRRCWLVRLTPEGHQLIDEILPKHIANERRLLSGLDEQEQRQLYQLLLKLSAGIEQS